MDCKEVQLWNVLSLSFKPTFQRITYIDSLVMTHFMVRLQVDHTKTPLMHV